MAYGTITVTTSATLIIAQNCDRRNLVINNTSSSTIYIGPDSSITTANAVPLYGHQSFNMVKDFGDYKGDVYGIIAANTADIRYWQETGS